MNAPRSLAVTSTLLLLGLASCDAVQGLLGSEKSKSRAETESEEDDEPKAKKKKRPLASASASASATAAPSAEPAAELGAMVRVEAGTLKAGSACAAVPRATNEELSAVPVELGAFEIDALPYPNRAGEPPLLGLTRAEAEAKCREQGKRLCSELEWERACKGPQNLTFSYGMAYEKHTCAKPADGKLGGREKCVSGFGMRDPHGLALEWTRSPWARGTTGLATVRGFQGANNIVRDRCASGQGRDPGKGHADVGFRCCRGPENAREVDLTLVRRAPLTEDAKVDPNLASDLLKALPDDHQSVAGYGVTIDRLWRWHPRDNEELLIARWVAKKAGVRSSYQLAVFKLCGGVPTRGIKLRGPVEKLADLKEDSSSEKLRVEGSIDQDSGPITITYWYGAVAFTEPAFVKTGNVLPEQDKKRLPRPPILKLPKKK